MPNSNLGDNIFDIKGKTLDAKILEILIKENGFSIEDIGTYFYKDVIRGVVFSLKAIQEDAESRKKQILDDVNYNFLILSSVIDSNFSKEQLCLLIDNDKEERKNDLRNELQELYSMFYYSVARNFSYITNVEFFHLKIKEAASKTSFKDSYLQVAYHLGVYIANSTNETEKLLDDKTSNKILSKERIK